MLRSIFRGEVCPPPCDCLAVRQQFSTFVLVKVLRHMKERRTLWKRGLVIPISTWMLTLKRMSRVGESWPTSIFQTQMTSLQIVGSKISRWFLLDGRFLFGRKRGFKLGNDLYRKLALNREHVGEVAIVRLPPELHI